MNSPRKLRSGFIETVAYIAESKYKSQLIKLIEEMEILLSYSRM